MAKERQRAPWSDIAPRLAEITDTVLFGEVWRRRGLSPRDRSLVTVACLIALYRTNELPFHLGKAIENGVTRDEIIEAITHLAFYSGWPTASTALGIARQTLFASEPDPSKGSANGNAYLAAAASKSRPSGLAAWASASATPQSSARRTASR